MNIVHARGRRMGQARARDNNVYALNAETAAELWRVPVGEPVDPSPSIA